MGTVAALCLGVRAVWRVGLRTDRIPRPGAVAALEPFFRRVVVSPGDDPSAIPLPIEDAQLIEIDQAGVLLVHVGTRVRRHPKPRAYQDIDGHRNEVSVRFDIAPTGDPRLVVGPYDRTFPLVIELQTGKDAL